MTIPMARTYLKVFDKGRSWEVFFDSHDANAAIGKVMRAYPKARIALYRPIRGRREPSILTTREWGRSDE